MTLCTQGYLVPVHAGFFNGVSEPDGDRLDGSPKSLFITAAVFSCRRSLHSDGLTEHARGRLCDRTPQWSAIPQWSCIQHSGVSLQPSGQLS